MHYSTHTVNGLRVMLVPNSQINSTTIQVMVKAGSIYETRQTNGLSHFLEHMFFKGGKKYQTPADVAIAVERFGGEFNAYTSDEYAGYYVKCAPDFISQAADVLADMMVHARFAEEELEREKGVVLQEIAMYEDNPQRQVMTKWRERYIGDTSYGRPILGPADNVRSFTQEQLRDHQQSLYTKDNLIIVVAGRIDDEQSLLDQLGDLFGELPSETPVARPDYQRTLPSSQSDCFHKETQQNHLIMAAPGFVRSDDRKYAASILGLILGGNMSSRMFQNIREKQGLCYYIGGGHSASSFDGYFYFRAGMDKDRFDFALEQMTQECATIAGGQISDQEFANAIGYRVGSLQMGLETSDEIASFLGMQRLLYDTIQTLEERIAYFHQLTISDVQAVSGMLAASELYTYWVE